MQPVSPKDSRAASVGDTGASGLPSFLGVPCSCGLTVCTMDTLITAFPFFCLLVLGSHPVVLRVLHSRTTPGGAQGTTQGAGNQTQACSVLNKCPLIRATCPTHLPSLPSFNLIWCRGHSWWTRGSRTRSITRARPAPTAPSLPGHHFLSELQHSRALTGPWGCATIMTIYCQTFPAPQSPSLTNELTSPVP